MGLDISCYCDIELIGSNEDYESDEMWDAGYNYFWINRDFPDVADDIESGWYSYGGQIDFRAGSYGGYNNWRRTLCQLIHGVSVETFWEDSEDYKGKPFYELINFSDCEGIIGPKTCAKLANDFNDYRELVRSARAKTHAIQGYRGQDYWMESYDEWLQGFSFAANTGVVQFH